VATVSQYISAAKEKGADFSGLIIVICVAKSLFATSQNTLF